MGFVTWIGVCQIWVGYLESVTWIGVCQIWAGFLNYGDREDIFGFGQIWGGFCHIWGQQRYVDLAVQRTVLFLGFVKYGLVFLNYGGRRIHLGFVIYGWVMG